MFTESYLQLNTCVCQILVLTINFFLQNFHMDTYFLFILSIKRQTQEFIIKGIPEVYKFSIYVMNSLLLIGNMWVLFKKTVNNFCFVLA